MLPNAHLRPLSTALRHPMRHVGCTPPSAVYRQLALDMSRRRDAGALTLLRLLSYGGLEKDCAAPSLFPAYKNDEPYRHRDSHQEEAHSESLRNLCDVEARHSRSLVERRQPHQARRTDFTSWAEHIWRRYLHAVDGRDAEIASALSELAEHGDAAPDVPQNAIVFVGCPWGRRLQRRTCGMFVGRCMTSGDPYALVPEAWPVHSAGCSRGSEDSVFMVT